MTKEDSTDEDVSFVFLCGKPIGEPIAQHGPVVMNTREEVMQFMRDYRSSTNGFEGAEKFHNRKHLRQEREIYLKSVVLPKRGEVWCPCQWCGRDRSSCVTWFGALAYSVRLNTRDVALHTVLTQCVCVFVFNTAV